MVVHRGTSRPLGEQGLSGLQFSLPFAVKRSKLATLSGQEITAYSQLATNPAFSEWREAFSATPGFTENVHEAVHLLQIIRIQQFAAVALSVFE